MYFLSLVFFIICFHNTFFAQASFENEKDKIVHRISELIDTNYVLKEQAAKYAKLLNTSHSNGVFDTCHTPELFALTLNKELLKITNDKHNSLRVIDSRAKDVKITGSLFHSVRFSKLAQKENFGFYKLENIEGNIGYLDFRRFYFPNDAKMVLDGVMNFLSGSNAIIIDLRYNQGGSLEMLPYIASYFLDYPTQLNSVYYRTDDFTREFWTTNIITTDKLRNAPLFILIGDQTFSAAEYFAYDMKVLNRAILVGDSTRGGAHSVDLFRVSDEYELYLSTAMAVNPITKKNWEGIGVIPNVLVQKDNVLDSTKTLAKIAAKNYVESENKKREIVYLSMQRNLDLADSLYHIGKDTLALTIINSAFNKNHSHLVNEFFLQVLAYHYASLDNSSMYLAIINKYINLFPSSYYPYESLAMFYQDEKNKRLAIENYERVLDLYPENRNAKKMIEKLKE